MRSASLAFIAVALGACATNQSGTEPAKVPVDNTATAALFANDAGCREGPMAQFGQYLGQWKIDDTQLAQDGSGWTAGAGAQWNFECLGNGTAIQDFWIPNGGPVGTNLRTYHSESGKWDIAWAIKGQPGFSHISAEQQDNGNIVMHYVSPPQSPPRRITFFPANENDWKWKLEFSFDGGDNWTEVYRINATRIVD